MLKKRYSLKFRVVLRPEESLCWEKFVKEVCFEPGVKE